MKSSTANGQIYMMTIFMFVSLFICTAKDIAAAKPLHWAFLIFLGATVFFRIGHIYLLPTVVIFAAFGIYSLFAKWPEYPVKNNRKWKQKWIKHPAEIVLYRSFVWIFKMLPLPVLSYVGGKLLEFVGPMTKRQKVAIDNLAVIAPECNNPEFIKNMWNNWGRVFVEGIKYGTYKASHKKYITYKNKELLLNSGQVLLAMPHYGYIGLMAMAFFGGGKRLAATYKFPSNPLSNDIILENYGLGHVPEVSFIPTGNAFPLMRAVKNGDDININSDQRSGTGELLSFIGRPAKTSTGLTQLACKFNLPVLIAHVRRTHGAHHEIIFDEIVHMPKTGDSRADELNGMQMVNDVMGRIIMQDPLEYLWVHRRWEPFNI
ncbi:MAG: hypothetical protein LBF28_01255 [Rickettsiales bacterium]|jgi:KDO2-lipid IV(A) lauroyltransferase|nr:hypothetical protein [Rickettsiales bacterium]